MHLSDIKPGAIVVRKQNGCTYRVDRLEGQDAVLVPCEKGKGRTTRKWTRHVLCEFELGFELEAEANHESD